MDAVGIILTIAILIYIYSFVKLNSKSIYIKIIQIKWDLKKDII